MKLLVFYFVGCIIAALCQLHLDRNCEEPLTNKDRYTSMALAIVLSWLYVMLFIIYKLHKQEGDGK